MKKYVFLFCLLSSFAFSQKLNIPYLEKQPVIDGIQDEQIKSLAPHNFAYQEKTDTNAPLSNTQFKIAYGMDFLYITVQYNTDEIITRNRGYQNGDGVILTVANASLKDSITDKFYVLGFSRTAQIIWYFNKDLNFKNLNKTQFASSFENGIATFEILVPWQEVAGFHPLLSKIGLNMCFVKAIGKADKNYEMILQDDYIMSENSNRKYAQCNFEMPKRVQNTQSFMILPKPYVLQGEKARIKDITIKDKVENIYYSVYSGDNVKVTNGKFEINNSDSISFSNLEIDTKNLNPEGYKIKWSNENLSSIGEFYLSVLPSFNFSENNRKIKQIENKISKESIPTLQFYNNEVNSLLSNDNGSKNYYECRSLINKLNSLLLSANEGKDLLATQTGIYRRAFKSAIDNSLQPYSIMVPANFTNNKAYKLYIFLHGSGQDDRGILEYINYLDNSFIAVAPKARGTSNCYSADYAQEDIVEVIKDVKNTFKIDTTNIILGGFSMGGYGVYRTFYEHPETYKALFIQSGNPNLANRWLDGNHPNFFEDKYQKPFAKVPMLIYHGKADLNCPFDLTEKLVSQFKTFNPSVEFIVDEKGHDGLSSEQVEMVRKWLDRVTK